MKNATPMGKPVAGNTHIRFDEGEVASAKPRRASLLCKRFCLLLAGMLAFASALADVEWEWDTSKHVDAVPVSTAKIALGSGDGGLTVAAGTLQDYVDGVFSSFAYAWSDSVGFSLTTLPVGFIMICR